MAESRLPEGAGEKPRSGITPAVRRLSRIARLLDAHSYLEIGVYRGKTFNALQFDKKVAVDPQFRFETAEHQHEGVEFHAVPSDTFFTTRAAEQPFDIIFLDGLHTFQQTFRDFCNSLACAHDRTVWLIDDVLPVDIYSAWPVESEALKFRRQAGGDGFAWHGDVYKVIFAIHDFFPMYSFVTIIGSGNPQSLVWKQPRRGFSPLLNSMEAIERLCYFDLLNRIHVLNAKTEQDAFRDFSAWSARDGQGLGALAQRGREWLRGLGGRQ